MKASVEFNLSLKKDRDRLRTCLEMIDQDSATTATTRQKTIDDLVEFLGPDLAKLIIKDQHLPAHLRGRRGWL